MLAMIKTFISDESGATAIEYGLIAALLSVAAVVTIQSLGSSLVGMFTMTSTTLNAAVAASGG